MIDNDDNDDDDDNDDVTYRCTCHCYYARLKAATYDQLLSTDNIGRHFATDHVGRQCRHANNVKMTTDVVDNVGRP